MTIPEIAPTTAMITPPYIEIFATLTLESLSFGEAAWGSSAIRKFYAAPPLAGLISNQRRVQPSGIGRVQIA
jgi:hypothetical protein